MRILYDDRAQYFQLFMQMQDKAGLMPGLAIRTRILIPVPDNKAHALSIKYSAKNICHQITEIC